MDEKIMYVAIHKTEMEREKYQKMIMGQKDVYIVVCVPQKTVGHFHSIRHWNRSWKFPKRMCYLYGDAIVRCKQYNKSRYIDQREYLTDMFGTDFADWAEQHINKLTDIDSDAQRITYTYTYFIDDEPDVLYESIEDIYLEIYVKLDDNLKSASQLSEIEQIVYDVSLAEVEEYCKEPDFYRSKPEYQMIKNAFDKHQQMVVHGTAFDIRYIDFIAGWRAHEKAGGGSLLG